MQRTAVTLYTNMNIEFCFALFMKCYLICTSAN